MENAAKVVVFLSTPSARRATPLLAEAVNLRRISIHALREEGDPSGKGSNRKPGDFYPRPPRGGRRRRVSVDFVRKQFLSTPSARRATRCHAFNLRTRLISIHALREEGDGGQAAVFVRPLYFYPRPPRGGRQFPPVLRIAAVVISIHALREEGDRERR